MPVCVGLTNPVLGLCFHIQNENDCVHPRRLQSIRLDRLGAHSTCFLRAFSPHEHSWDDGFWLEQN